MTINGCALSAQMQGMLATELFLTDNYRFRRNVLNGKTEFAPMMNKVEPEDADYRPLTQEALNSIILRAKREEISDNPKSDILTFVHSEEVPVFNPVQQFLDVLPVWDGKNHVAEMFSRLPGISSEQSSFLAIWLRSMVAHWLQRFTAMNVSLR